MNSSHLKKAANSQEITMIRPKIIPVIIAAFFGAFQFQGSEAHAQYISAVATPPAQLYPGSGWCATSPDGLFCLWMQYDGTATFEAPDGSLLWQTPAPSFPNFDGNGYLSFQTDGNLVVYDYQDENPNRIPVWWSGTTWGGSGTSNGNPGAYLVVQWYGVIQILDANMNVIWYTNTLF
jgi:hypothetical protein